MTEQELPAKKVLTVGLVSVGIILVMLMTCLIFVTTTGRYDTAGQPAKQCLETVDKTASVESESVTVEDVRTWSDLNPFSFMDPEREECADTTVHVSFDHGEPIDFAALAYGARNVSKDGTQCTWTDSKGDLRRGECTMVRLGADSEVH